LQGNILFRAPPGGPLGGPPHGGPLGDPPLGGSLRGPFDVPLGFAKLCPTLPFLWLLKYNLLPLKDHMLFFRRPLPPFGGPLPPSKDAIRDMCTKVGCGISPTLLLGGQ
jgi:hypothetical protein